MGSKKYREFFDEHNIDKLKDKLIDFSPINTNKCKSNTCKDQENGPSSQCMLDCCREECKDKNKDKIIDNGKPLSYSEFDRCMVNCTDP
jgi:hypothetical protein